MQEVMFGRNSEQIGRSILPPGYGPLVRIADEH